MRYVIANKGVYEVSPVVTRILDEEKLTRIDTIEKLSEFDKNVRNSRKNLVSLFRKLKVRVMKSLDTPQLLKAQPF